MTTPEQPTIPTYFAPVAFELARQQGDYVSYNASQLAGALTLTGIDMRVEIPDHLVRLDKTAFVFRYAVPGHKQPVGDESFYHAAPTSMYIPANELAHSPRDPADTVTKVTKAAIQAEHTAFQIQVDDRSFEQPLVRALVMSLIYPPAEDLRMIASPGAWWRQIRETIRIPMAHQPGVFNEKLRRRHVDVVAKNFAGAIVLRPRIPRS